MTSNQIEQTPRTQVQLSAFDLYDIALGEALWPAKDRTIRCSISGAPYAQVTEQYVRNAVMAFGAKGKAELATLIAQSTLFAKPSPMWQSKTPITINNNRMLDPAGFLVYMINSMLAPEKKRILAEANGDNLATQIQWQKENATLYDWAEANVLGSNNRPWLDRLNDILLLCSGNQCLPVGNAIKGKTPGYYANKETLEALVKELGGNYKRRKAATSGQPLFNHSHQPHRLEGARFIQSFNSVHAQAAMISTNIAGFDEKAKKKLYELQVESLLMSMDIGFSMEDKRRASSLHNSNNAFLLTLDRVYMDVKATTKQPILKAEIKPAGSSFSFGRKKEV